MTKSEFISKLRKCKECETDKFVKVDFSIDYESLTVYVKVKCANCGKSSEGHDVVLVLADWNAKNFEAKKRYVAIIQHKESKPLDIRGFEFNVESISEITLYFERYYPDYDILSIREIVS